VQRQQPETILNREELEGFRRHLAKLSVPTVEGVYNSADEDCRYDGRKLPPVAIQQLVAAWKMLADSKDEKNTLRIRLEVHNQACIR